MAGEKAEDDTSLRRRLARSCSQQARGPPARAVFACWGRSPGFSLLDEKQRSARKNSCAAPTALDAFPTFPSASALGSVIPPCGLEPRAGSDWFAICIFEEQGHCPLSYLIRLAESAIVCQRLRV